MLLLFQLLFVLFSFYAIWNVVRKRQEGSLSRRGLAFWIIFWLLADLAVIWPNSTTVLANALGIGRGSDFVIYISLALLFFLIFKLHIKIETINRDVTKIVRDRALKHAHYEKYENTKTHQS